MVDRKTPFQFILGELRRVMLGGMLHDLKNANAKQLKLFSPREVDVSRAETARLDEMRFQTLNGEFVTLPSGRPTVLMIGLNQLAWNAVPKWRRAVPSTRRVDVYQLSVAEGFLASYAKKSLQSALKNELINSNNEELVASTGVWVGSFEKQRQFLGLENRAVNYVYLLDGDGHLRWRTTGEVTEDDLASLKLALAREE